MATGRPLLGIKPVERARVWIWNGEDPAEELDRRIIAAMIQHGVKPEDIEGYLFRDTGREVPLVVATQSRNGTVIARPTIDRQGEHGTPARARAVVPAGVRAAPQRRRGRCCDRLDLA